MSGWKTDADEMKPSATHHVEDHLILLQEKKKQQKRLKQADEKQMELVRREKGFTLYVNGANAALTHANQVEAGVKTTRTARPKTCRNKFPGFAGLEDTEAESAKSRAKTAPSARTRRRQWQVASIDLKTCSGDRVKIKAPGASTTGNYDDDFEENASEDSDSLEEEILQDESSESEDSSEIEERLEEDDKFDEDAKITNTILRCNASDVKKLRESLELRTSLQHSLAKKQLNQGYQNNNESSSNGRDERRETVNSNGDREASKQNQRSDASDSIETLLQKIMKLDAKSQHRLMKVLSKLDDSPRASTAWVNTVETTDVASVHKSTVNQTPQLNAEKLDEAVGRRGSSKSGLSLEIKQDVMNLPRDELSSVDANFDHRKTKTSASVTDSRQPYVDKIEVSVELLSNWDHPRVIGLTELELLDSDGQKIEITPSTDVLSSVSSLDGCRNDIGVLFNGKSKTKKERHMWSCDVDCLPVIITINAVNRRRLTNFNVSALRIWNYNRSPSELSAGARHIRVTVNGRLAYDGELSRGVANQIFDYDQIINLTNERTTTDRGVVTPVASATSKPTKHATSLTSNSEDFSIRTSEDNVHGSIGGHASSARHRRRNRIQSQIAAKLDGGSPSAEPEVCGTVASSADVSGSTTAPNVVVSTDLSCAESGTNKATQESSDVESRNIDVPASGRMPSWLNVDEDSDSTRPTSGGRTRTDEQDLLGNWPSVRGESHLPTLLDVANTGLSQSGMTSDLSVIVLPASQYAMITGDGDCLEERPLSRMKQIESTRALRRKRQEFSLEESWTSLDLFNRCQKGRISFDIQDDVLDEYLAPEKPKPNVPAIPEVPASTPESVAIGSDGDFTIPELPYGQNLVINIRTTWGDKHYVGLNGIEIFAKNGQPVSVSKITADPSDINILPGYSKDPRVVTNLTDGVNRTQDDTHMWLAPFTSGKPHYVYMTFDQPVHISVMRIWNYNKSRIHSSRGAKDIEITLDGVTIFVGEIARACGSMIGSSEAFGDTILFTMDEDILELVAQNDQAFQTDASQDLGSLEDDNERPATADGDSTEPTERPVTCASRPRKTDTDFSQRDGNGTTVFHGRHLVLDLESTWGDQHYIGLTGLEVVGRAGEVIPVDLSMIDAEPRDLHHLPGHEDDDRTLDKLIDGENVTMSDEHMWLIPFSAGHSHEVKITFSRAIQLTALRVWNYNKSPEDTFRGVRTMHVSLDGRRISPAEGFLIRKGPGNCFFDFAQQINFSGGPSVRSVPAAKDLLSRKNDADRDCDIVLRPRGFIYQFQLLSSWADAYYVGLNGIELYDSSGNLLVLNEANIAAYPDSVNVLNDVSNDVRTPEKLIDGVNDTMDGRHMWLAPILPNIVNRVYVIFDEPIELSMIRIWNYSKTPTRGVRDLALLVDDLLVYNGTVNMASSPASSGRGNKASKHHTIQFTDSIEMAQRERHDVACVDAEEQQIQLMNDRKLVPSQNKGSSRAPTSKHADPALRPTTSMPRHDRPTAAR